MLDAAYAAGLRYFDAARSYGRAEEFLGDWLSERAHPDAVAGSKWGYRYTGDWRLDARQHEVKEHSLAMFRRQLGADPRPGSAGRSRSTRCTRSPRSPALLDDRDLLAALGRLRDSGVRVGLSTSGPRQDQTLRRALAVEWRVNRCSQPPRSLGTCLSRRSGQRRQRRPRPAWPSSSRKRSPTAGWLPAATLPLRRRRCLPSLPAQQVSPDAVALAAVLAQPWATVVLSGAVTPAQLTANVAALTVTGAAFSLELAEPAEVYWSARSARSWTA